MPSFIDVEQITLRGGPEAFKYGDPYVSSGQAKIEHDRYCYVYGLVGEFRDMRSFIRDIKKLGKQYGWVGIRWERLRNGKVHIAEFSI